MKYILSLLLAVITLCATAQNLPERGEVRRGNKSYLKEEFAEAAEQYAKAMALAPEKFEARYNLGNALLKGEKVEEAEKLLTELAADSLLTSTDRAAAYYNLGNTQFQQQKLKEALESYKSAMRQDPSDMEAKYNYAYTKALMEQNQDQEQEGGDEDQENQDQDQQEGDQDQQEGDQDQNQDQQDQNQDEQDQDQGDQEQDQQPQPQEGEISEQELQQMLDAIQAQEDKTQEDMKERARGVVVPGARNW